MTIPERLPAVALRDLVFFPHMVLPLLVGRSRSRAAMDEARAADGLVLLLAQRDPQAQDPTASDLHRVGTVTRIVQTTSLPDGTTRVVFEGLERVKVERFVPGPGPFRCEVSPLPYADTDDSPSPSELRALGRRVERAFREYAHLHPDLPADLAEGAAETDDPVRSAHLVAGHLLIAPDAKQQILEASSLEASLRLLLDALEGELEILGIENQLDEQMRRKMDDERRRHYLQEQLEAIRKELGSDGSEWDDLESRLSEAALPEHARRRGERELERLRRMNPVAPEAAVIRGYLEWILDLPWEERTEDSADVRHARKILDSAHFGLQEVKDRILDHIGVLSVVGQLQGPILCLVGPPGVGKTSLGKSIATALDRRFVRVALGGVRDEAEIRGHRRTYVGSLPGRILQGVRRARSRNPVFLLDEVDKLARDGHGDPAAALLEVLDPEQNRTFQDHYLELEFDLSDVLFVATANTLTGIPDALRDRMEVIRIPGYLDTEKRAIARKFLVPGQLRKHGLDPSRVDVPDPVVDRIIEEYTREAGVRELDRMIASVARKMARRVAEARAADNGAGEDPDGSGATISLASEDLRDLLGPPPHVRSRPSGDADRVGVGTGLAWTAVGGEVLEVEVSVVPGRGEIRLTGTLGDVMKESAVAALTFARARSRELGIDPQFHRDLDLHIHIPEGATPKDGPSAGITIGAALISALTGVPTRPDAALTGEITLRGRVLPVGGLKEKAVAALRNGIDTVVFPAENARELELLPTEVRERVTFHPVDRMDQALALVLAPRGIGQERGALFDDGHGDALGGSHDPGTRLSQ